MTIPDTTEAVATPKQIATWYINGYVEGSIRSLVDHAGTREPKGTSSPFEAGCNDGYNGIPPRLAEQLDHFGYSIQPKSNAEALEHLPMLLRRRARQLTDLNDRSGARLVKWCLAEIERQSPPEKSEGRLTNKPTP